MHPPILMNEIKSEIKRKIFYDQNHPTFILNGKLIDHVGDLISKETYLIESPALHC